MKLASGLTENKRSQIISNILDLAVVCPHDDSNPPFCPLYKVRKLEPKKRLQWALQLTDAEMDDIAVYHKVCFECRSTGK
jgi:hypothetical protein